MEIVNTVITAIVAGIISSSKETASQAVKEAYVSFKNFIKSHIENINFSNIEKLPDSSDAKAEIEKALGESKMCDLTQIYDEAKKMIQEIDKQDKETITSLNIVLEDIEVGGNFKWDGGKAGIDNRNFTGKKMKIDQDFTIG